MTISVLMSMLFIASCASMKRSARPPSGGLSAAQKIELERAYIKFFWDMKFIYPPEEKHLQLEPGSYSK